MTATIPVPIEFSLPEGWRSVPPDEVGAAEAAFVALHPNPTPGDHGFTANITISGEIRPAEVALTDVADETLDRLRAGARDLKLGRRSEVGSAANPGLTQAVRMTVDLHGRPQDLAQLQVFLGMRNTLDAHEQAVLHIVLSATPDQFDDVVGDFQQFIASIRPEPGAR
jgi:hypothetical protein